MAPQLSQVPGIGVTVPPTVLAMSRWVRLAVAALVVTTACGDDADGPSGQPSTAEPSAPPSTSVTPATSAVTTAVATRETTQPPPTAPTTTVTATGIVPVGFDLTAADVTMPDGTICRVCLWVAATPGQRTQGLMGVTDLGAADGMVFLYDTLSSSNYWMWGTPLPLSIAFFAADGSFVSATDMQPCLDGNPVDCARYAPAGPFAAAVETVQGGLDELGIVPGSRLTVLHTPCEDPAAGSQ